MKNYFKHISTKFHSLWVTIRDKFASVFQRFRPRSYELELGPDKPISPATDIEVKPVDAPLDVFTDALMLAAKQRANQNYSPLGDSHEFISPAGAYLLSQTRHYIVYTPSAYQLDEALPLVMVLHGCKQTHLDIRAISGFDEIADRERFIVVYPFITRYLGLRNKNCWGWWYRFHSRSGNGEVEDLRRIIEQVQEEFTIDPDRIHITGLSSGAGMSVAALVAHGKLFASGASVAGVAYGESARAVRISHFLTVKYHTLAKTVTRMKAQLKGKGKLAPLLIVQSLQDKTVELQAALNLRDSWLTIKRARKEQPDPIISSSQNIEWYYRRYERGNAVTPLETLLVEKLEHGWIGGNEGSFSDPRGPNISEMIWLFFKLHPR